MKEIDRDNIHQNVQYVACWIPLMAQRNLKIIRDHYRLSHFHTTNGSATYHITTNIDRNTIPEYPVIDNGLTITVSIVAYEEISPGLFGWIKWVRTKRGQKIGGRVLRVLKEKIQVVHRRKSIWERLFARRRVTLKTIKGTKKCKLELIDYLQCGLAEFRMESDSPIQDALRDYIIRQIVSYFHDHHYHEDFFVANKSILLEYPGVLSKNNNPVLANYIGKFARYIEESMDAIYIDYRNVDIPRRKRRFIERFYILRTKEKLFYDACHNLLGVMVFLNTLLNSPQNTHWRLQAKPQSELESIRFEDTMVLENAKHGVVALLNKVRYHHDRRDYWLATIIGVLGCIIGISSVILALLSPDVRAAIVSGWKSVCDFIINVKSELWGLIQNIWDS